MKFVEVCFICRNLFSHDFFGKLDNSHALDFHSACLKVNWSQQKIIFCPMDFTSPVLEVIGSDRLKFVSSLPCFEVGVLTWKLTIHSQISPNMH